ncbi:hypothetical protein FJZ36_07670 [Candidatus Poribacteria bacterium]|nr:hypothetical protein [Candidatus Poribacteria bacterium]
MRREIARALVAMLAFLTLGSSALCQTAAEPTGADDAEESATAIRGESTLRRFEIVTLVALPFTAVHSYVVVRSVRVAQAGSLAAGVEGDDWNWVGVGAAGFAIAIAAYDWLRLRGKDRNEPLLPELPTTPSLAPVSRRAPFGAPLAAFSVRF